MIIVINYFFAFKMDENCVINNFLKFLSSIGIKDFTRFENLFDFFYRLYLNNWDFYKMDCDEMEKITKDYREEFSIIYGYAKYNKH